MPEAVGAPSIAHLLTTTLHRPIKCACGSGMFDACCAEFGREILEMVEQPELASQIGGHWVGAQAPTCELRMPHTKQPRSRNPKQNRGCSRAA